MKATPFTQASSTGWPEPSEGRLRLNMRRCVFSVRLPPPCADSPLAPWHSKRRSRRHPTDSPISIPAQFHAYFAADLSAQSAA